MIPRHRVAGRILALDGGFTFSNAVLQLDEEQGARLQGILEQARQTTTDQRIHLAKESGIDPTVLACIDDAGSNAVGTAVLQFWLNTLLEGTLDQDAGIDVDDDDYDAEDGELFEFYTRMMELDPADASAIAERLDALPGWKRALPDEERWIRRAEPDTDLAWQGFEESLMDITLQGDQLVIETESKEAMDEAVAELEAALGALVGEACIMCEEIEEPIDAGDALRAIKDEVYGCLLDEVLPGFGNRTPRQLAGTGEGRDAVVAWLRELEESEQQRAGVVGIEPYDTTWIWRELGLEDERQRPAH